MKLYNVINLIIFKLLLIRYASSFECNNKTCPTDQGECIENICFCAPGYTTFYPKKNSKKEQLCNYPYKYKYYAIWFEMLFPFGMGHFYACRYFNGITKFTLFCILALSNYIFKKRIRRYPGLIKILNIILWIFWILYCTDFFCFNFDYYLDGNKIPLIKI